MGNAECMSAGMSVVLLWLCLVVFSDESSWDQMDSIDVGLKSWQKSMGDLLDSRSSALPFGKYHVVVWRSESNPSLFILLAWRVESREYLSTSIQILRRVFSYVAFICSFNAIILGDNISTQIQKSCRLLVGVVGNCACIHR